ncbi:MAG: hypothetical protein PHI96_08090 [Desulfovibrio sp.]|nr:hypothetical protein [Desulfovibrio sp.]
MTDWTTIANILMAVATCIMAWATWRMARATNKTLEAQWKPYVTVYPQLRNDASRVLQIVIENIGSAPAYDVKFKIPHNLLYHAWGIPQDSKTKAKAFTSGPFITGIPYLPPRGKRIIDWGQYGGILKSLQEQQAEVTTIFSNAYGDKEPPAKSILDIKDFKTNAAASSLEYRKTDAIEKTSKTIGTLCSIFEKKLKTQSHNDAYMWAYIATKLGLPIELAEQQNWQDGLSEEQREAAIASAHTILKRFRPELVKDDEEF